MHIHQKSMTRKLRDRLLACNAATSGGCSGCLQPGDANIKCLVCSLKGICITCEPHSDPFVHLIHHADRAILRVHSVMDATNRIRNIK